MRRIRIRTLLALTLGGLVLIATVLVLGIAFSASMRNTFELLNQRMVLVLDGIENEVRDKLGSASSLVDGIAAELQTAHSHATTPQEITDVLTVVLATAPDVGVLLFWDNDFVLRGVAREPDGTLFQLPPERVTDPRQRHSLETVPADLPHVWGPPVASEGQTFLNVVTRVPDNTYDVRYVGAAVSLAQFSKYVSAVGERYGATAFILYGDDALAAHPYLAGPGEGADAFGVVPISEALDPVIAALPDAEALPFTRGAQAEGITARQVELGDEDIFIVMTRELSGFGDKPLTIGAYYRADQVGGAIDRLFLSGIAGLVVVVVAVITALLIGGILSRPVRRLAESATAIARLETATAPRPKGSAIAEIDDQARAFNVMLDGLKVFETYVPKQLVQRLIALGEKESVESELRELTVMFTDIVGFTAIADRMGADETAQFLNRHFSILADCIQAQNGSVDKYIGDAIMAFWGAPDRLDDHAARAVACARMIAEAITRDNRRRARKGLKPIRIRIGLHTGAAVVGNIGAPGRVNYTIIGDTVNVAQRLETLGRRFDDGSDAVVLMSADTARLAAEDGGLSEDEREDAGAHTFAGVSGEVSVIRLKGAFRSDEPGQPSSTDVQARTPDALKTG